MGCSSIVDPRSAPTTPYVPAATDSIYTTTPNVVLRPGDPLTVSVNVVSLPNAPLDLYILMDLSDSMAAPLATVKSISQLIAQQVSSITTNVRIGFGAFNDKPIYPYSPQTPAGCLPGRDAPDCSDRRVGTRQYSFLHLVNFTSNFSVPNVFVTTNLDLPESSFDALVQVLACEQELGWRNRSVEGPERGLQRFVLLITDNQPHLAGDGREVVQTVELTLPQPNDIDISVQVNCPSGTNTIGQMCTNVALNQIVEFSLTLTLQSCSTSSSKMLTFSVPGFGATTLSVDKICSCSCDKDRGTMRPITVQAQYTPSYSGKNCSCTNFMCPFDQFTKLICSGRGYCGCKCECDSSQYGWKWEGEACECPSNMNDCYDVASNIPIRTLPPPPCSNTIGDCVIQYLSNEELSPDCKHYTITSTNSVAESSQFCVLQSGDCIYIYSIISSNGIQVVSNPECQIAVWKIIIIVVGGLLFLFIVICVIVKIVITILNENPLYQNPETCYTNVMYGKSQ
ncbi:hypothetical protein EMCRGX_G012539 [Ephydatia muelleri]